MKPNDAHGYCQKHYRRWKKYGDPNIIRLSKKCLIKKCKGLHHAKGYCNKHYSEQLIYPKCSYENCNNEHHGKGYCDKHYKRLHNYGDVDFVKKPYRAPRELCLMKDV